MKKIIIPTLLILIVVIVALFFVSRTQQKHQIIHHTMELRADAIMQKADSFIEFYRPNEKPLEHQKVFSECSSYILAIEIPSGAKTEFINWMDKTRLTVSSADDWPKNRGSFTHVGTKYIYYIAIYHNNDEERKMVETHLNKTLAKLSNNTIPEIELGGK